MGRKLDLSGLTDDETEHVLQVVQRDFNLRKKEEERLSEMKQKLDEEGSKCSILSKHQKFVEHCCMRCCAPFTFLVNTKRRCGDCKFNVCKSCCSYQKHEKVWVCCVCQQARNRRSLTWSHPAGLIPLPAAETLLQSLEQLTAVRSPSVERIMVVFVSLRGTLCLQAVCTVYTGTSRVDTAMYSDTGVVRALALYHRRYLVIKAPPGPVNSAVSNFTTSCHN
ncbi:Rab effector MyRIP [Tupaia chinensis]|uniref:Rab effector MyRIP n=1 Tax=Tupaia chinensis TaxID=246437 RepID=L9KA91_TUPCH|nr:Rab effector MyRIP [Tupaia chinensis]